MTPTGSTGPAQSGGAAFPAAIPALSELSQTELELLAGRQQAERRAARLRSPEKTTGDGSAGNMPTALGSKGAPSVMGGRGNGMPPLGKTIGVTAPVTNGLPTEQQPAASPPSGHNAKINTGIPIAPDSKHSSYSAARPEANPEPTVASAMLGNTIQPPPDASTVAAPDPWEFMRRVVAWPGPDDRGYVNLHYFPPQKPGEKKPGMRGRAFRDLNEFMGFANWCITHPAIVAHTYFALATQAVCGKEIKGHKLAHRNAKTALKVKSIWLDIDAGPGKGYPDAGAAHDALAEFVARAALPQPSALVSSGSGLHVYWISDRPLTVAEWRPHAEALKAEAQRLGLKCDYGLTTDEARVLRVPGTRNGKTSPPRLVELKHLGVDYDFATALARLAQPGAAPATAAAAPTSAQYGLSGFANGQARAFTEAGLVPGEQSLAAGIRDDRPLDPGAVFRSCLHFREAATTHGAGYPQGLWMLDVLSCTFFDKGRRWAHYLSKGYGAYDRGETDAMWERKLADKQSGIGWPSCQAFEDQGCKSCATCPFRGKIKSPLNLVERLQPAVLPFNAPPAPRVLAGAQFRDFNRSGGPKPSLANAVIAIHALGIGAVYDLFHHRINVTYNGQAQTIREGLLTDDTVSAVRSLINNSYFIDCGDANTFAAIKEIALENAYDPVLDMVLECQGKWDGVPRLDTWVIRYLGCADTPLNRAIGRKVLIAAVRRARLPGCKFDTITVLEGVEGTNKSTAIRVLAGDENFSDQSILGASDKEVQEQLDGIWMHENADLAGMRRTDVEHVKAFASRQTDRARPAYGRVREDRRRRSIEWGTTNDDRYLLSQSGNRRFWPLKTGVIDIDALRRDRDQLLGEAATYEAAGEGSTLDLHLWADARDAQEQRRVPDPWEDLLRNMGNLVVHRAGDGFERVASADVLEHVLQVPRGQQNSAYAQRLAKAMEHAGWDRNPGGRVMINGVPVRGYVRRVYASTGPTGAAGLGSIAGAFGLTGLTGPGGTELLFAQAATTGLTGAAGTP